jgi:hypothetical protein
MLRNLIVALSIPALAPLAVIAIGSLALSAVALVASLISLL